MFHPSGALLRKRLKVEHGGSEGANGKGHTLTKAVGVCAVLAVGLELPKQPEDGVAYALARIHLVGHEMNQQS